MLSALRKFIPYPSGAPLARQIAAWGIDPKDARLFTASFIDGLVRQARTKPDPQDAFLREFGHAFIVVGKTELGIRCYRRALEREPGAELHGMLLQALLLSSETDNERLYNESVEVYRRWMEPVLPASKPLTNVPDPEKPRLKIGYICHFFHNSVSSSITNPFIKAHDRSKVEIFCYSDADPAEVPPHVREIADTWRDTKELDADAFEALIRQDCIDIAVEMNGHNAYSRYDVLARRAAPVQISFYNQASSCGIPAIDYTMIDTKIIPPEEEQYFSEFVYRLPHAYGAAGFRDLFPDVTPPPCLKNGFVTFGSFGASHKVTEYTVDLWCRVLNVVPNSRFFMKAGALTWDAYRDVYARYFENRGISRSRIIFEGWSDHADMLKRYADVDIALDTYPHNGGTTTLEALWMGIPVVSLAGDRLCTRTGMSMLTNLGRPEWVARDAVHFAQIAAALAADPETLKTAREEQREKMRRSVLCDVDLYARDLEDAYRFMWRRWCQAQDRL